MKDTGKLIISGIIGGFTALAAYQLIKKYAGKKAAVQNETEEPYIPSEEKPVEETSEKTPEHVLGDSIRNAMAEADSILDKYRVNYTSYSEKPEDKPSIISITPDQFGEDPDYERITWTYYTDGIVADQEDRVIDNYEDYIGKFKPLIGKYDPDVAYVRNTDTAQDYEILVSDASYEELTADRPYLRGELEDHD